MSFRRPVAWTALTLLAPLLTGCGRSPLGPAPERSPGTATAAAETGDPPATDPDGAADPSSGPEEAAGLDDPFLLELASELDRAVAVGTELRVHLVATLETAVRGERAAARDALGELLATLERRDSPDPATLDALRLILEHERAHLEVRRSRTPTR